MRTSQRDSYTGGSYLWLADTVTKVVNNLRRHNVEPIVVSVNIETHIDTKSRRDELRTYATQLKDLDRECPYAYKFPLRHIVIAMVLLELKVELLVGDGGRTRTKATIANELECPILSTYQRPLFYPIRGGVMLIGGQERRKYESRLYSDEGVLVREWNYEEFMNYHGIGEDDFALVSAADGLRNGMSDGDSECDFHEKLLEAVKKKESDVAKIDKSLELVGSQDNEDGKLQLREYRNMYREIAKARSDSATLVAYLRSNDFKHETKNRRLLPPAYQERMRRKLFPQSCWSMLVTRTALLPIFEEHPNMHSSKLCSRRIRQYSYAILLNFDGPPSGQEYFQNDGEYQSFSTETDGLTDASLNEIPDMTDAERWAILARALNVHPANEVEVLCSETPLLSAVIQYWVEYCQPEQAHQDAIHYWKKMQHNFLENYRQEGFKPTVTFVITEAEQRRLLHPFAQLTSMLQDAMELNRLLLNPLPDVKINFDFHYLLYFTKAMEDGITWESKTDEQVQESSVDSTGYRGGISPKYVPPHLRRGAGQPREHGDQSSQGSDQLRQPHSDSSLRTHGPDDDNWRSK